MIPVERQEYPAQAVIRLAERLASCDGLWVIGGSTGLAMRGARLGRPPRDLDVYTDEEDVKALHACLADFAVDRPEASETGLYRSILSHYEVEGTTVELVGGFRIRSGSSVYQTEVRALLHPLGDTLAEGGSAVRLVPLGHELIFNALRRRPDRCEIAAGLMHQVQEPESERQLSILRTLMERNRLSPEDTAEIARYAAETNRGEEGADVCRR